MIDLGIYTLGHPHTHTRTHKYTHVSIRVIKVTNLLKNLNLKILPLCPYTIFTHPVEVIILFIITNVGFI